MASFSRGSHFIAIFLLVPSDNSVCLGFAVAVAVGVGILHDDKAISHWRFILENVHNLALAIH